MSLFVWDATYSVDIHEIDRQHKRLFGLFNELYDAMQEGHADDVIEKVLTRLVDYTAYHFETEEKLFAQYGYHDEAAHRAEHANFVEQVKMLVQKLKAGDVHVSLATLKLLSDWLNQHILGSDQKFAPFLLANGVR
jgi:hemerythrin